MDGHLRAYSTTDGKIPWDYDTAKEYQTVDGIVGKGGSIDGFAPIVADGMLFVNSGYGQFGEIPGNALLTFEVSKYYFPQIGLLRLARYDCLSG